MLSHNSKILYPEDIRNMDDKELKSLAHDIREFIIQNVSKTGGHLASNLGVVELTLALHSVYKTPEDKIIWDVGHQSYIHKIITGRMHHFDKLRQFNGLSGFPKRNESIYDVFQTGHSSTSISAALGISRARDINKDDFHVVAVIGDGALTGGMAFEALNDAGASNTNLTVILNDNQMSISKNVGSISSYLSKLRTEPAYSKFKHNLEQMLKKIPVVGKDIAKAVERMKDSLKYFLVPGMLFEDFGFTYLGPVDGHDIGMLKDVLLRSKKIKGPVLIHVMTKKGKGYNLAEKRPDKFHGVGIFDVDTGEFLGKSNTTYSEVFGDELIKLAQADKNIVAVTAAMPEGTGLTNFSRNFPDRFFDVGIAEQHAVTMAAGLAVSGMKPVVAVYSTFLQRAYDQILHDVCIQNLPVVLAIDRSGIVGDDGETHQGVFDLSFLRHIPNIVIMAPKSTKELREMLSLSLKLNCPVAIRYPRGTDIEGIVFNEQVKLEPYKAEVIKRGKDVLIISCGKMTAFAYKAAWDLGNSGIDVGLINARFVKPLDENTLLNEIKNYRIVVTIEDNVIKGGFGSGILELLSQHNISDKKIKTLGFPDEFVPQGNYSKLFDKYNLDSKGIIKTILNML
ncbi:1-deoxy-D-xylulose-5-phosphate synthase [Oxobacter pfennigii]|uniref:1-deoxy-D-xylulose-5-phosphate synthase n=1 Tax=Oxobacter pfennigii TaxID=36849 RepID=A0A0P9AHF8_9CLOT|nr:1-deoxy-D-xylulose-5-phosphate synthase [Oxobacter pfennigii]KPU44906.1 1-deoxy-D-xylulose-5-phosphate synthase [Oxobacter pfennigii]